MSTETDSIIDRLDQLVAPFPNDEGDWDQVVERVGLNRIASPARPPRHRRRSRLRLTTVPAVAAVAGAIALALLWPFSSSPSVLDNALAAVGTGPITHVVLEENLGSYLLDLRTGKRTATTGREEIWYQPNRGLLTQSTFNGSRAGVRFLPALIKITADRLTYYRPTDVGEFVTPFVAGYRAKLRAHAFHLSGSGTLAGVPVYWISSTPAYLGRDPSRKQVEQVAISKTTYKPLYFRTLYNGHVVPASEQQVISIETTTTAPVMLKRYQRLHQLSPGFGWSTGYPQLTLTQTRAIRPRPLIPMHISGLRLSWTGSSPYNIGPNDLPIPGVWLYYGSLYNTGLPNDTQPGFKNPYIEILEFPHANPLTRVYAGRFPANGTAVINGLPAQGPGAILGAHTATLQTHGFYLLIQASSAQLAIAAARTATR
jgi:hypothetical protein